MEPESITEQWIRGLALRFGLDVLKRITTGSERAHFATFELSGLPERVGAAWLAVWDTATTDQQRGGFVYYRASDATHEVYIGIESVWCDAGKAVASV